MNLSMHPNSWLRALALLAIAAPLADAQQKLLSPSSVPAARFGSPLDIDSGALIVGSEESRAWVFEEAAGSWQLTATLEPTGAGNMTSVARSVALSGSTAAVGARGAVFLFERGAGQWSESQRIDGGPSFGTAVDMDGERLAVGQEESTQFAFRGGAVFVYQRVGGSWQEEVRLPAPTPSQDERLGRVVALDADTLVAVLPGAALDPSVLIWERSAGGWSLQQELAAVDVGGSWMFGNSLALDGDILLVGDPLSSSAGTPAGAGYVFERAGGSWSLAQVLGASGPPANRGLGRSCAIAGTRLVMGAPFEQAVSSGSGAVYVYERDASGWSERSRVVPCDATDDHYFGRAVGVAGAALFSGATGDDEVGLYCGAVYVNDLATHGVHDCSQPDTWYVDASGVAPGSGSESDPFTSITYALAQFEVNAGDTVLVRPGTYVGSFTLTSLRLISTAGPAQTRISLPSPLWMVGDGLARIEGFTIESNGASDAFFSAHGYLVNNVVRGFSSEGIAHMSGVELVVDRCTFADCGTAMLLPAFGWVCLDVTNSIFWNNGLDVDNYFAMSISVRHSRTVAHRGPGLEAGIIEADPLFWDAAGGDWQLRAGSPCIDSGVGLDADGSPADMGAIAFDSGYAPEPQPYCTAAANSVGAGARIGWSGGQSIAANAFVLEVTDTTPNQWGKFYYGPTAVELPFGDGSRCVGAGGLGTFRLYPSQLSDASGAQSRALDFTSGPTGVGPGRIEPGSSWYFQFWYRDPYGPGGTGFNLSDGLQVGFAP